MFKGELFPFQKLAVDRMIEAKHLLLAMEMGLGKTVVVIAAVEQLIDDGLVGGGIIIAPASIKYQWARMIDQFTEGTAKVAVVDGVPRKRLDWYSDYRCGRVEYLIINPEQMVGDWDIVRRLPRDFIVADECQWAKNFAPKRSKRLKRLEATYQWGLTGQPVENRPEEIFSIFQWIDPTVLGRFDIFDRSFISRDHFGRPRAYRNLATLHKLVSDHMVRHTRDQVKDQLPAITEQSIYVEMDEAGARLYRRIVRDLERALQQAFDEFGNFSLTGFYTGDPDLSQARGDIMSKLTCLRMLLDSPDLLRRSAAHYRGEIPGGNRTGSVYAEELHLAGALEKVTEAPKIKATVELITDILDANPVNKCVVFSNFKDSLDLLATATKGLTQSVLFTGDVNAKNREVAKQRFALDADVRLFLSSDAGGVGLDLPQGNYLISLDLPWSAGAYAQRQARIIRLSSQFPQVTLISMQVKDSLDEYQAALLAQKQKIADAVVDGRGIGTKGRLTLDLQSLTKFLSEREL
jgi:SNF2 family DNA or RNA helicase